LTLGEELWIAQQSDEIDGEDDLEEGLYTSTGTRSKTQGFLAHGGAGGTPVVMGMISVEGAGEEKQASPEGD
jgi:hypothetical protein